MPMPPPTSPAHPMEFHGWTVFIDGSAKPNPGKMGIGGVIDAPDGSRSTFSLPLPHIGCNNEAEAWAAIHALRYLLEQHAQHVVLNTDSSILAEQLSLPQPKRIERLAEIYSATRDLAQQVPHLHVQWVPRHKNQLADALCRRETVLPEQAAPHALPPTP